MSRLEIVKVDGWWIVRVPVDRAIRVQTRDRIHAVRRYREIQGDDDAPDLREGDTLTCLYCGRDVLDGPCPTHQPVAAGQQ